MNKLLIAIFGIVLFSCNPSGNKANIPVDPNAPVIEQVQKKPEEPTTEKEADSLTKKEEVKTEEKKDSVK